MSLRCCDFVKLHLCEVSERGVDSLCALSVWWPAAQIIISFNPPGHTWNLSKPNQLARRVMGDKMAENFHVYSEKTLNWHSKTSVSACIGLKSVNKNVNIPSSEDNRGSLSPTFPPKVSRNDRSF